MTHHTLSARRGAARPKQPLIDFGPVEPQVAPVSVVREAPLRDGPLQRGPRAEAEIPHALHRRHPDARVGEVLLHLVDVVAHLSARLDALETRGSHPRTAAIARPASTARETPRNTPVQMDK